MCTLHGLLRIFKHYPCLTILILKFESTHMIDNPVVYLVPS